MPRDGESVCRTLPLALSPPLSSCFHPRFAHSNDGAKVWFPSYPKSSTPTVFWSFLKIRPPLLPSPKKQATEESKKSTREG